jgi:hypothetical protein
VLLLTTRWVKGPLGQRHQAMCAACCHFKPRHLPSRPCPATPTTLPAVLAPICLVCNHVERVQEKHMLSTQLSACVVDLLRCVTHCCWLVAQHMQCSRTSMNSKSSAFALTAPCGSLGAARRLSAPPPVIPTARPVTALPWSAVFELDCPMPPRWHLTRCLQLQISLHHVYEGTVRQTQVLKAQGWPGRTYLLGHDLNIPNLTTPLLTSADFSQACIIQTLAPKMLTC